MIESRCAKPWCVMACSLLFFCLFATLVGGIFYGTGAGKPFLAFDQTVSHFVMAHQRGYALFFSYKVTDLGESGLLALLTFVIALGLWVYRLRWEATVLASGFGLTGGSVYCLKLLTSRIPPQGALLMHSTSTAFPSGHAALSLFFYGFLAYLLSRGVRKWPHKLLVWTAGGGVAGVIGATRVYLNVHWLSDVIGGYALAAAFLSLCIGFVEMHRRFWKTG